GAVMTALVGPWRYRDASAAPGWLSPLIPVVGLLAAVLGGCSDKPGAAPAPPPPVVKPAPVLQQDVPISAEWVGTLVGYVDAQIRARVSGHLVSQGYREGSLVKAGDLLFQVDP